MLGGSFHKKMPLRISAAYKEERKMKKNGSVFTCPETPWGPWAHRFG